MYRCTTLAEVGSAASGRHSCHVATVRIRRGDPVLFGNVAEKVPKRFWLKYPCKAVGVSASCRFQSALLIGGQETAAPCLGASRPHSPLTVHRYGRGGGVGRGLDGGLDLGDGVGRGVEVNVAVGVGVTVAVGVAVAVAVGVAVAVAVAVAVGVGV